MHRGRAGQLRTNQTTAVKCEMYDPKTLPAPSRTSVSYAAEKQKAERHEVEVLTSRDYGRASGFPSFGHLSAYLPNLPLLGAKLKLLTADPVDIGNQRATLRNTRLKTPNKLESQSNWQDDVTLQRIFSTSYSRRLRLDGGCQRHAHMHTLPRPVCSSLNFRSRRANVDTHRMNEPANHPTFSALILSTCFHTTFALTESTPHELSVPFNHRGDHEESKTVK
ncbi:hypothetical protein BC567DRAFT_206307 [Phyllosticta citribraziliensis]